MAKKINDAETKKPAKKSAIRKDQIKKGLAKEDVHSERKLMDPFPEDDQYETYSRPREKELSVEVLKAKITNEIFLYSEYKVNQKDDKGTFKKDGENPIHDDLKKAFAALTPHLANLAEQYNNSGELDKAQITCRGFGIGGNGEGVTLSGTRLLTNGKPFNFNTPYYKWDTDKSESLFEDEADDLRVAVNKCIAEVIKYLFKHKYQPELQGD